MARDLTSGMIDEVDASQLSPIFLIKGEFDGGDVRFWSGYGEITFNSEVYTGSGNLLGIDSIDESQELVANGVTVTLNGVSSSLVSVAQNEDYSGRPLTVWFGCLSSTGAIISNPYMMFKGRMDVIVIEDDGETCSISVNVESDLIGLRDSKERRYTDEDQKAEYPGDRGFEFVALSQDVTLSWGVGV